MLKDDEAAARSAALSEFRDMIELMRVMSIPAGPAFYDGQDFSNWPPGDGERMLIPVNIGAR